MAYAKSKKEGLERILNPQDIERVIRDQATKLQSNWRKVVTGDEKKRIRDRIRETQDEPKYVKFFDKVAFTVGVLNMGVCQYFLLNRPDLFPYWYASIIPLILGSRYFYFRSGGNQYFMIDFCYFAIFCSMMNLFLIQNSALFFRVCYICCTGPLTLAIPVWRNSFVFHDYDKIVSVYIHILPSMLYYTLRHNGSYLDIFFGATTGGLCTRSNCEPLRATDYVLAVLLYMFWQFIYLYKTEFLDKKRLDNNPELMTSLRWLAQDTKNAAARAFLKAFRMVGIFKKDEDYDSRTLKTKIVFVFAQLIFTVVSFIPTPLMYRYSGFHLTWIILIVTSAVFNGASFYIEVFSKRYNSHIAKIEEMHKIAKAASTAMSGLASLKSSNSAQNISQPSPSPLSRPTLPAAATSLSSREQLSDHAGASSEAARARTSSHGGDEYHEDDASAHAATEDLAKLAEMLQHTSDSAWLQMKEHFQRADELRGLYANHAAEDHANDLLPDEDDYVVCQGEAVVTEHTADGPDRADDALKEIIDEVTADEGPIEAPSIDEDTTVDEDEQSLLFRDRGNSVLSIDR